MRMRAFVAQTFENEAELSEAERPIALMKGTPLQQKSPPPDTDYMKSRVRLPSFPKKQNQQQ